jgi:hypothetical protein
MTNSFDRSLKRFQRREFSGFLVLNDTLDSHSRENERWEALRSSQFAFLVPAKRALPLMPSLAEVLII